MNTLCAKVPSEAEMQIWIGLHAALGEQVIEDIGEHRVPVAETVAEDQSAHFLMARGPKARRWAADS